MVKTDQVNYQELQERLEQAEQLVVIQNAVLQGFLHQGKITPQELEEMMQQIAHAIEQADDESGASTSQQVSVVSKKKK